MYLLSGEVHIVPKRCKSPRAALGKLCVCRSTRQAAFSSHHIRQQSQMREPILKNHLIDSLLSSLLIVYQASQRLPEHLFVLVTCDYYL